ncbi:MAG TPA: FAD-dependent oxidoreductase, partial [Ktedonobacteraceae bacterium]
MGKQLSYLIIGNGITGITAAEMLRSGDPASSITIVADDPFPVYYRPALKDYLGGRLNEEKLWVRPNTFYQEQQIRFVPGRVMGIDTAQHVVQLHNGQRIGYDNLLLANGARPRQLACPGLNLAGVTTLRTVADYQEILRHLESAKRIVVCGSGTLALESAETLNHRGYEVTHLLRQHLLWSEVLDPIASDLVLQQERRDGIDVRTEEEIAEIVGRKWQVSAVITTSGARIPCDMVLIAIGIEPLTDFIRASGIACGRGVKVDHAMRTNVPHIYAAGDVIETTDALTGRTRVLGQWYPAIEQARTAAYSMLGQSGPRAAAPSVHNYYNATFLYGLDFVSVGLTTLPPNAQGYRETVADPQPRNYRKVILRNGIPLGMLFLGDRKNALAFKRTIDHGVNLASIAGRLFADDFNLDEWLDNQGVPPAVLDVVRTGHYKGPEQEHTGRPGAGKPLNTGQPHTEGPMRAYLAPIPHPRVRVSARETVLGSGKPGEVITIGRQKGSSLLIEHHSVSRLHSEIIYLNGNFLLRDRGSANGTFVNNAAFAQDDIYTLRNLDHVRFGDVQFRFELRQQMAGNGTTPSATSTIAFPHVQGTQLHASVSRIIPDSVLASLKETPTLVLTGQEALRPVVVGMSHRSDVQTLTEERLRFEIDMCIGCDRCMSACPVPMSTLVNIADLNHATITNDVAAHVARFTHECIMCGSCVPVCPVDNHRDLLMLSLKRRLGVSWDSKADLSRSAESLPAGWKLAHVMGRLRQHRILSDERLVPENYLLHLVATSRLRLLAPGETVIREGEYGRDLYLILKGRLALSAS